MVMTEDKKEQEQQQQQQAKREMVGNGVVNPSGALVVFIAPLYLALVPATSFLTKPDSIVQSLTHAMIKLLPGIGTTAITSGRAIPALATLYLFWTFVGSGAISVAGQAMARPEGLDNEHPRAHLHLMRGLPLRMRSAHYSLLESFPAFALAAALTQLMAPEDAQLVNLLGFHVMAKLLVHYPAYVANMAAARSLAHVGATSALVNVVWRLAAGN